MGSTTSPAAAAGVTTRATTRRPKRTRPSASAPSPGSARRSAPCFGGARRPRSRTDTLGTARSDARDHRRSGALAGGRRERFRMGASALPGLARRGGPARSGGSRLTLLYRGLLLQRSVRSARRAQLQPVHHPPAAVVRRGPAAVGALLRARPRRGHDRACLRLWLAGGGRP